MKKSKKTNLAARNKRKRTAQASMPWQEIYVNGMIRTDDNTYAVICTFDNVPYLSQTESEQRGIYGRYVSMLNGLSPNIGYQEVLYSRPVDREQLRKLMVPPTADTEYAADYRAVQERFCNEIAIDVTEKVYLLTLSYTCVTKLDNPYGVLCKAVSGLQTKYQAMGSNLRQLGAAEVLDVLYELYNPFAPKRMRGGAEVIDARDIIAPGDMEFKAKKVELGNACARVYTAWRFGGTVDDTFITDMLQTNARVTVTKHVEHVSKDIAIAGIQKRLKSLEGDRQTRLSRNKQSGENYIPLELDANIKHCRELIEALSGDEDLFRTTVLVGISARTDAELAEVDEYVVNKASEHYVTLKSVALRQEEALNSLYPFGINTTQTATQMLSSAVGALLPYSYPTFLDTNGIYYGKNVRTGEPVIVDRKRDKNSNGFIFGKSGGGKSFYAKLEISALLASPAHASDDVIVVDPDGEFVGLACANNDVSEVVRLSSGSSCVINPFDVSEFELKTYGSDAISNRVNYIVAFISALKGGDLTAIEKTLADRAASNCYKQYVAGDCEMPDLCMFDALLAGFSEAEAHTLRMYIERYVRGSVKLFTGQTNVNLDKKLTVFDLTLLGSELKDTGMIALLSLIWNRVYENHKSGKWTWIYFDELHRYYRQDNSLAGAEIERLYAEIRKYGGIVTSMTQHPQGVLASPAASSMLANSQFVVLFEQDDSNIDAMAERCKLNADQRRLLLAADTGEAVLRTMNSTMAVQLKYTRDNLVYRTITTDFKDKAVSV